MVALSWCKSARDFYYLTVIKGRSPNTVVEYRTDILMVFSYLKGKRGAQQQKEKYDLSFVDADFIRSIALNDMYAFLSDCQNHKQATAGTRERKIVSIRQFRKHLKTKAKRPAMMLSAPARRSAAILQKSRPDRTALFGREPYFISAARSASGVVIGAMPKFSTRKFSTLGLRKAGSDGPRRMFLMPRYRSVSRMHTAFCSYHDST